MEPRLIPEPSKASVPPKSSRAPHSLRPSKMPLTNERKRLIAYWIAGLAIIELAILATAVWVIESGKYQSVRRHELRMSPDKVEPGLTPPEPLPPDGNFVLVTTGMYLDDIESFSIRDSSFTATFDIWFRWNGDKGLNPAGEFRVVDGKIEKRELTDAYFDESGENFQVAHVTAHVIKFFDTVRVPLEDHLLTIGVEDAARDGLKIRYVADPTSAVGARVKISGYDIGALQTVVKRHTYRTSYGDPRVASGAHKTFTQFLFGLPVKRSSIGLFVKIFIGLFAGIAVTLCSFFIRPSDSSPRFALPTASYFGAVANSYLVSSMLPVKGQFGLTDYVTVQGLFTIFLCVAASLVSYYFWVLKKDEVFSRALDRATRTTIFIVYIVSNVTLIVVSYTSI